MIEQPFPVGLVDDEPLARAKIRHYLQQYPKFMVCGEAATGAEAIHMIARTAPSVLFLDIELPDMSGLEVIRRQPPPQDCVVVFATAHEEYALRAFEAQALDYLVKPISPVRFSKLMLRVEQRVLEVHDAALARNSREFGDEWAERLICRAGSRSNIVSVKDVAFVEAARNYAVIHANRQTHIVRRTLESLEASLDPRRFVRVSRSVIVNKDFIKSIEVLSHGDHRIEMTSGEVVAWTRKLLQGFAAGLIGTVCRHNQACEPPKNRETCWIGSLQYPDPSSGSRHPSCRFCNGIGEAADGVFRQPVVERRLARRDKSIKAGITKRRRLMRAVAELRAPLPLLLYKLMPDHEYGLCRR